MRFLLLCFLLVEPLVARVQIKVGDRFAGLEEAVIDCRLEGRFLIRELEYSFRNTGARQREGELICSLDEGEEIVSYAMAGKHSILARFYGDWRDGETSVVTAEVEVTRHFGTDREVRRRFAVRLSEKEIREVATVKIGLEDREK